MQGILGRVEMARLLSSLYSASPAFVSRSFLCNIRDVSTDFFCSPLRTYGANSSSTCCLRQAVKSNLRGLKTGPLNVHRCSVKTNINQPLQHVDKNVIAKDVQIQERQRKELGRIGTSVCYNCHQEGHFSRECPQDIICHACGEIGHISRECPKMKTTSQDSMVCYLCNKTGHFARNCPERTGDMQDRRKCYQCGSIGHIAKNCPNHRA